MSYHILKRLKSPDEEGFLWEECEIGPDGMAYFKGKIDSLIDRKSFKYHPPTLFNSKAEAQRVVKKSMKYWPEYEFKVDEYSVPEVPKEEPEEKDEDKMFQESEEL